MTGWQDSFQPIDATPQTGWQSSFVPDQQKAPDVGIMGAAGIGALQGVSYDTGDEALGHLMPGDTLQNKEQIQKLIQQTKDQYPISYYAGDIAGTIASPFTKLAGALGGFAGELTAGSKAAAASSKVAKAVNYATQGANVGGMKAFGQSNNSGTDLMQDVGGGVALGAPLGVAGSLVGDALGAIGGGASNIIKRMAGSVSSNQASNNAQNIIVKELQKSGVTPNELISSAANADQAGLGATLPEYTGAKGLLNRQKVIAKGNTEGADILSNYAEQRATDLIPTKLDKIADSFEAQKSTAGALYTATKNTQLPAGTMDDVASNPVVQQAIKKLASKPAFAQQLSEVQPNQVGYWHLVRQQLDDLSQRSANAGMNNEARVYGNMRTTIGQRLQQASPDFADANNQYAQGMVGTKIKDALEGTKEGSIPVLYNKLFGNKLAVNDLTSALDPKQVQGMKVLMGSMRDVLKGGLSGSDTAFNLQTQDALAKETGSSVLGAVSGGVKGVFNSLLGGLRDKVAAKDYTALAKAFTNPDVLSIASQLSKAGNIAEKHILIGSAYARMGALLGKEATTVEGVIAPALPAPQQALPSPQSNAAPTVIAPQSSATPSQGFMDANASEPTQAPVTAPQPNFIQAVARVESNNNPNARNPNSSAYGLYQLTKDTWKSLVQKYGQAEGVKVSDINNPQAQSVMMGHLTNDNTQLLTDSLGRQPSPAELYAAHFMGAPKAARLIKRANSNQSAASLFPKEAKANPQIFYSNGKARTPAQVLGVLGGKIQTAMN